MLAHRSCPYFRDQFRLLELPIHERDLPILVKFRTPELQLIRGFPCFIATKTRATDIIQETGQRW